MRGLRYPSRRRSARAVRTGKNGDRRANPEPRRDRARSQAAGGCRRSTTCARNSRSWRYASCHFRCADADIAKLEAIQHAHGKAVDAGDLLAVFQSNVLFHRALFGLCGNTSLIETIESLAQKVSGIRSYAHAKSEALNDARRDHIAMIKALRNSRRDDLMSLTRRHLKPAVRAYIDAYRRRFGVSGSELPRTR